MQDKRRIIEFPAPAIEEVILLSLIGSTKAEDILYINEINTILIIGWSIINTNIKSPILLIAFFITREYPATEVIASENAFPTIGIKLSTANFVVFKDTASMVLEVIPLIVKIPINIVITPPWIQRVICFMLLHKLSILCSSDKLLANSNTKDINIRGIIMATYILGIINTPARIIGSRVAAWVNPPLKAIIETRTGKIAFIKSDIP